jgi:hypothetical protein
MAPSPYFRTIASAVRQMSGSEIMLAR